MGLPNLVHDQVNQSSPTQPLSIAPQNMYGRSDQFIPNVTQSFSMIPIGLMEPHYQGIAQSYVPQYRIPQGASSLDPTDPAHLAPQYGMSMWGWNSIIIYSMLPLYTVIF